jgi:SH3 domain protein
MKCLFYCKFIPFFSFLFLLGLFFNTSYAETKYISGLLVISVRDGIEKTSKSIGTVRTGDQVETLEESNRFIRIRTKENLEGWIPVQFIQNEAPKMENIARLKEELAILKKKNEDLVNQTGSSAESGFADDQKKSFIQSLDSLKAENKHLLEENQKLQAQLRDIEGSVQTLSFEKNESAVLKEKISSLQNKLDTLSNNSKDIVNIIKERDNLAGEIEPLRSELAKIKEFKQAQETQSMYYWFIAGAAVFFAGLLSSKFFNRKKSKLSF